MCVCLPKCAIAASAALFRSVTHHYQYDYMFLENVVIPTSNVVTITARTFAQNCVIIGSPVHLLPLQCFCWL